MSKSVSSAVAVPELDIVRNRPIAKFMYKGTHSKPIRRTVVLTEIGRNTISGYEVRSGRETRLLTEGVFKTYNRSDVCNMQRYAISENF